MADFWYDPEIGEGGGYWPLNQIIIDLAGIAAIVFLIFGIVAVVKFVILLIKHFCFERKHLNAKIRQEIDQALFTIILCFIIPCK